MWKSLDNKIKTVSIAIVLFVFGYATAFACEEYYRQLVRFLFKFFNGNNIVFIGKNFHLFPSSEFTVSFGVFCTLTFFILHKNPLYNKYKAFIYLITTFVLTTSIISWLDSKRLIIECTACDDGIRKLSYNQITYDAYFIISLVVSILFLLLLVYRNREKTNKLIGVWSKEDDGSGLFSIWGWSLTFNPDMSGVYNYWSAEENTEFTFQWQEVGKNEIRVKADSDKEWTTLHYEFSKVVGSYDSPQWKLNEIGKNKFWCCHEPLYKRRIGFSYFRRFLHYKWLRTLR